MIIVIYVIVAHLSLERLTLRCMALCNSRDKCPLLSNAPSYSHLLVLLSTADETSVKSVLYYVVNFLIEVCPSSQ